jgi:hypothetical protein
VATFPVAGDGTDCVAGGPADCGVSREADLEIRFDRFLSPATAIRQSVRFYSESLDDSLLLLPEYDVLERVLVYRTPLLEPGVRYTVELLRPEVDDADFGFRAFDGAPLEEGDVPLKFQFKAEEVAPPAPPVPPAPPTCDDAIEILSGNNAGCAGTGCHTECPAGQGKSSFIECGPVPRMGLDLSTPLGLSFTAINHVAHQTETGSKTGAPIANPARFGTSMPVIDPGRPENSYLLYKMLRKDESFFTSPTDSDTCQTVHAVGFGADSSCTLPSVAERDRMREWFVRGEAMPLVVNPAALLYGRDAVRGLQEWIRAGAVCN